MKQDDVKRALEACYDAISSPETWADALHNLARSLDATASMFFPKDVDSAAADMPASRDYQDFLVHYVEQGWYEGHYRAERGWPLLANGKSVVIEHDLATDEERRKLPHYHDLYLRWGYKGFAAVGFEVDGKPWCVPFLRSISQGFFTHEEAMYLRGLGAHFSRMVRLSERFALARGSTSLYALERIDRAAALIDANGRVMELNSKAEALLERCRDTLFLKHGLLWAVQPDSNRRLQTLIAACTSPQSAFFPLSQSEPVSIEKPLGRPLLAEAVAIRDLVTLVTRQAHAILLISDLEEPPRSRSERVARIFRLTPAEARLCDALMAGSALADAADELQITRETARQRLKVVFHKTGTHRQSELALLLSRL